MDFYGRGRENIPMVAQRLYDEIDGDEEWFTSTLIQIRIINEVFRDLGWDKLPK